MRNLAAIATSSLCVFALWSTALCAHDGPGYPCRPWGAFEKRLASDHGEEPRGFWMATMTDGSQRPLYTFANEDTGTWTQALMIVAEGDRPRLACEVASGYHWEPLGRPGAPL